MLLEVTWWIFFSRGPESLVKLRSKDVRAQSAAFREICDLLKELYGKGSGYSLCILYSLQNCKEFVLELTFLWAKGESLEREV